MSSRAESAPTATGPAQGAGAVRRSKRQRRPTGAPPPLPWRMTVTTTAWLVLAAIAITSAFLAAGLTPWGRADDQASTWLLRRLAAARTPWLTHLANGINEAGLDWHVVVGIAVVLLVMLFRRWRHLLVLVFALFFLEILGSVIYGGLSRPRPYGVLIIGAWGGFSAPPWP